MSEEKQWRCVPHILCKCGDSYDACYCTPDYRGANFCRHCRRSLVEVKTKLPTQAAQTGV